MNYSITLNEFIDRINNRISEEIELGKNYGHVNYTAFINGKSLLEVTSDDCTDGSADISRKISKKIAAKLRENPCIDKWNILRVEYIAKPQEDLTNELIPIKQKIIEDNFRKCFQVKIGFKAKIQS